jgi:hypothetical protein
MANRRQIKREINYLLGDVLEECYSEMLNRPDKNEKEIDAIIDDAVDLADDLISRINNLKNIKTRKDMKAHFNNILIDLEDKTSGFIERLNKLS